jgi:pyruvate kinase
MTHLALPPNKTRIVCTIGPASSSPEVLAQLVGAGMNIARLNFAHGDLASHAQVIADVRKTAAASGKRVAIMGDLPGPKMRLGKFSQEPLNLALGQSFVLHTGEMIGDAQQASVSFSGLPQAVKSGDLFFVNDGFVCLRVEKVVDQQVHCEVVAAGEIRSFKGIHLPGIDLGISAFTEQDHEFLKFAAEQKLDAVSQSFVEGPEDIAAVREAAGNLDYFPFIIAKIERSKAVKRIDSILDFTDGIMVARGDLGVEIPIEEIALVQKELIRKARMAGKPVITATQMLQSMTENRRPTRAEATDVSNAILDGTDCIMLSEETAMGIYPVEAVDMMSRIAVVVEPHSQMLDPGVALESVREADKPSKERLVSLSVYLSVEAIDPVVVIAPTLSGATPRLITRFRLPPWIIAISPDEATCQTLQFSYGVHPVDLAERPASWTQYTRDLLEQAHVTEGLVLLTQGTRLGRIDSVNQIEVIDLNAPPWDSTEW